MSFKSYKRIIFHCGLHKTGSSFLQSQLRRNSALLAEQSIHYPEYRNPQVATLYDGNHSAIGLDFTAHTDLEKRFAERMTMESDCDTLLISGERFSRVVTMRHLLPKLLAAKGDARLDFVFYLRRYDHLLESSYAEKVKMVEAPQITPDSWPFNFTAILRPVIEAVGKENVIIRPYNKVHWVNGSLGDDFCTAIGQPGLWDRFDTGGGAPRNESLPRACTFLLSRLSTQKAKAALIEEFRTSALGLPQDKTKFFLSPDRRRALNAEKTAEDRPFLDEYGLGEVIRQLGMDDPDSGNWTPFVPDWERLMDYMAGMADRVIGGGSGPGPQVEPARPAPGKTRPAQESLIGLRALHPGPKG